MALVLTMALTMALVPTMALAAALVLIMALAAALVLTMALITVLAVAAAGHGDAVAVTTPVFRPRAAGVIERVAMGRCARSGPGGGACRSVTVVGGLAERGFRGGCGPLGRRRRGHGDE